MAWRIEHGRRIIEHYRRQSEPPSSLEEEERFRELVIRALAFELNLPWSEAVNVAYSELPITFPPRPKFTTSHLANPDIFYNVGEHKRQAKKLAGLFAPALNMSNEEYISTIPPLPWPSFPGYPNLRPLIVEGGRIPWREQARLSGINVTIPKHIDIVDSRDPQFIVPEKPFTVWVAIVPRIDMGLWWPNFDKMLTAGERWTTTVEGIAYLNAYPDIVAEEGGKFSLLGSHNDNVAPLLSYQPPHKKLDAYDPTDSTGPLYPALVSRRETRNLA